MGGTLLTILGPDRLHTPNVQPHLPPGQIGRARLACGPLEGWCIQADRTAIRCHLESMSAVPKRFIAGERGLPNTCGSSDRLGLMEFEVWPFDVLQSSAFLFRVHWRITSLLRCAHVCVCLCSWNALLDSSRPITFYKLPTLFVLAC